MWGVLDAEPDELNKAAGHLGDILTKLDHSPLAGIVATADVYGDPGLASTLGEFTGLARVAARLLQERVGLTGTALRDTATLFQGTELDNEAAIRRAGR
ncbi:hypothetical protein EDD35_3501 [Amycolatopsis thermoflava]|uniref:Uncharacterized protein n=1 Tax=Amycolatopsis thermoflava TaxID=84480 RepID=A0A3N2GYE2_9PSEU|nr:hypothetical protein EDD35_3501 [Amycolatopsis thermoflava]